MKRIFIINRLNQSYKYGVGKYISELVMEGRNQEQINFYVILIGHFNSVEINTKVTNNITYIEIPSPLFDKYKRKYLSLYYSKTLFVILNELYQFKNTDIIHFNSSYEHFLMELFKKHTNSTIMYTIHISLWRTFYQNNFKNFFLDFNSKEVIPLQKDIQIEIQCCQLSDRIICLSESMLNDIVDIYKIEKKKIHFVRNGIKEQKISRGELNEALEIKSKLNISNEDFVFLYVGRLIAQKGINHIIKCFKELLNNGIVNIKLLIVGNKETHENLINNFDDFNENIIFTDYIPNEKIKLYYKISNALLFPSLNEQSSYTVLEAMTYRIPLIVSNSDFFNILTHKETCYKINLTKEKEVDENSLKEAILIIMNNKKLVTTISKNAFKLFLEKYTSKKMFNSTYLFGFYEHNL